MILARSRQICSQIWRIRCSRTIVLSLIMIAGCAPLPPKPTEEEADLQELCTRYGIQWQWDSVSQMVTLSKEFSRARALVGSNVVILDNEKILLSQPLRRVRGTIIVPIDFKRKVIESLAREVYPLVTKFKEVVIDAGHGGKDPGTIGRSGLQEKTVVLDIAKSLKRNLEQKGIKVIMTRDRDDFISLEKRTEIASRSRANLFVSIHANASPHKSAKGLEIFYLRDLGSREKNDPQIKENRKYLFERYTMQKNSPVLENILLDMLYTYKRAESERLARYLTQKTSGQMKARNRGSKSSGFFVLRNTLVPAVLIEVGFLSNPQEEKLLKTQWYRQKIADSLAESILKYARE